MSIGHIVIPGLWTQVLGARFWTQYSGQGALLLTRESSFWFSLIELLKILWVRLSKNLMVTLILYRVCSKVVSFRIFIRTLRVTNASWKNCYKEKLDKIKRSFPELFRSSRPFLKFLKKTPVTESFFRTITNWQRNFLERLDIIACKGK